MEPHDLHDYDGINESILIDLTWEGEPRRTLVHPERNGYVYLMDRLTGEVLYAKPFRAHRSRPPSRARRFTTCSISRC